MVKKKMIEKELAKKDKPTLMFMTEKGLVVVGGKGRMGVEEFEERLSKKKDPLIEEIEKGFPVYNHQYHYMLKMKHG
ncbi:TPA: hypothetical protein HA265_01615 [Candidatus Woesearchaeota archaeon]|nr:hypothetical protein [Candidatus Woesearchaeota archaeon]